MRKDKEPPPCIEAWGWQFHHLGIPTTGKKANEKYIPQLGMHVSGFPESPYGVEWMRFDKDSPIHPLIQQVPHLAYVVPDLDEAIRNKTVLTPPTEPSGGIRVAMIEHNGAPVELMEISE